MTLLYIVSHYVTTITCVHIFFVNVDVEEFPEATKPPTVEELPTNSLLWTSVKCVGISLGVALVCGVSFHLLWNKRVKELKGDHHKPGKYS